MSGGGEKKRDGISIMARYSFSVRPVALSPDVANFVLSLVMGSEDQVERTIMC